MAVNITKELKKYIPIFREAREQGVNEAETSLRISKLFEEVLGYDIFTEISREHVIKDRRADYAIKIKGKVEFLVEVKQAGTKPKEKHIEQAANYAANAGIPWVVLTSGGYWQLYHLTFDEGIQSDLIWSVDILEDDIKEAASRIALLHRKSIIKGKHEDYLMKMETLSPGSVIQAIFQENTLNLIRRHLKKMSGVKVDEQDLADNIKKMISKEAWEEIGEVKIKRKRKVARPRQKKEKLPLSPETPVGAEDQPIQPDPPENEEV